MSMEDVSDEKAEDDVGKGRSKWPLLIGFVLAMLGGVGGFFAVQMDFFGRGSDGSYGDAASEVKPDAEDMITSFVPLEPIVINLPEGSDARHLLFRAELEVDPSHTDAVIAVLPRIVDVLNGYLRSVTLEELQDPTALFRLRAQMLRRVKVVTGDEHVKNVLIMEFVLN